MKNNLITLLLAGILSLLMLQNARAQYSNATFNGPWLMHTVPLSPFGDSVNYLVFDGAGHVIDGNMFPAPVQGTYNVNSNGSFTLMLTLEGDTMNFGGLLISQNESQPMGGWKMTRVPNPGALTETLTGTLITNGYGQRSVSFTINHNGIITGSTGLTNPVSGRVYAGLGMFIGHVKTGDASGNHWNEFSIFGYYSNDSLNGAVSVDGPRDSRREGTALLIRSGRATPTGIETANTSVSEPTLFPNPATSQVMVTGLPESQSSWNYQWIDLLGRTVGSGTTFEGASISSAGIPRGVCFLRLSGGTFTRTWRVVLQE